jgi:uncharacterized protein YndB with AHSA1/START domain
MIDRMGATNQPPAIGLHLEKTLPAAPDRVFAAFVDPGQLGQWWGPLGFTIPSVRFDAVPGTEYRIAMQPPDADAFRLRGMFQAVDAPGRLAFTFIWEPPDPDDQETLVSLAFEPSDAGTRLVLDQGPFKTAARYELHRDGWSQTFDRLEEFLG